MHPTRQILSVLLAAAILVSPGRLLFSPEDANRNTVVDLEDAILLARDFVLTADGDAVFTTAVRDVVSTLHVVAGLKVRIAPLKDAQSSHGASTGDAPFLAGLPEHLLPAIHASRVIIEYLGYASICLPTVSPPPRRA